MSVFERLARPLAHGVDLGAVARSTLKHGEPLDVEWLMAGLPRFQEAIVRAKYQLDSQARHEAWAMLFMRLMEFGWNTERPGIIEALARGAITEWIDPKICKRCGGVGSLAFDAKIITCNACEGTGRRFLSDYMVKKIMALDNVAANNLWASRFRDVLSSIDKEEFSALHHMIRRHTGRSSGKDRQHTAPS